jgi:hypothetical protein
VGSRAGPDRASDFGVVERKEDNKHRGHGVMALAVVVGGERNDLLALR